MENLKVLSQYESPVEWWMLFFFSLAPTLALVVATAIVVLLVPLPLWASVLIAVLFVGLFLLYMNYLLYRVGGCETIAVDERGEQLLIIRQRRLFFRRQELLLQDIAKVEISEQLTQRHTDYNQQGCICITLRSGKQVTCGRMLNLGESRQLVDQINGLLS